jgi:hypothetical protein
MVKVQAAEIAALKARIAELVPGEEEGLLNGMEYAAGIEQFQ